MNSKTTIVIYVSVNVLPAKKGIFVSNLIDIVSSARLVEGCLKYQWFINPDDNSNYVIYGEFDTEENFLHYKSSEVVSNIGKLLLPLLTEKPNFKHFRTQTFEQS